MSLKTNNTIELVGYGHPDRFADYVAEVVLEAHLRHDKTSKVAVEILAMRDKIVLGGEVSNEFTDDFYTDLVRGCVEKVYGEKWWPGGSSVEVINNIKPQSPELQKNQAEKTVAGDQGVIYGYYNKDRFQIISGLYDLMENVVENFDIAADWKLLFNTETFDISMSVCGEVNHDEISKFVNSKGITLWTDGIATSKIAFREVIVNPKGTWLIPGPLADTGVVGRKLMIDTFGAGIPHGGGAFCGKDPSKVDKTGIIIASYLAKDASNFTGHDNVLVELNYKIGDELPRAFAHYPDGTTQDISSAVNLTLDEYIKTYGLLDEAWSEYVLEGGVISYLNRTKED